MKSQTVDAWLMRNASEDVRRVEIPCLGIRGRDLLARELFFDERDFETIDSLNANDTPPDIP